MIAFALGVGVGALGMLAVLVVWLLLALGEIGGERQ